ncbi:MAG: hypothetical protein EZS28_017455 [Streblomastix strix]|uniref:Uncharacterized protein n=1 Tax=Streblomastix strix TaxID=222440 RepID=A0A5J4VWT8_9EUKA|nr:MAG: hypothetical protein EZS28_017455 [Streblomastix strix]
MQQQISALVAQQALPAGMSPQQQQQYQLQLQLQFQQQYIQQLTQQQALQSNQGGISGQQVPGGTRLAPGVKPVQQSVPNSAGNIGAQQRKPVVGIGRGTGIAGVPQKPRQN